MDTNLNLMVDTSATPAVRMDIILNLAINFARVA